MELDCKYSSILEAEGSGTEVEVELEDGPAIVSVSEACSSVFLRLFFSFLDEMFSEAYSCALRFFLRSGFSEAEILDNTSLIVWRSAHRWALREARPLS